MWLALRTEIAYFRVWLLGGLGIAAGVIVLLSALIRFAGEDNGTPIFVLAIFPVIAGMVVSFITQSHRVDERRSRLLLAGPLTPRDLATLTVLLPTCFVGLAALAGPLLIGLGLLIAGKAEAAGVNSIAGVALQFLAYAQLGPLAQESSVARRQQRPVQSLAGWVVFAGTILGLAVTQFFLESAAVPVVGLILLCMATAWLLYQRRTDFTR